VPELLIGPCIEGPRSSGQTRTSNGKSSNDSGCECDVTAKRSSVPWFRSFRNVETGCVFGCIFDNGRHVFEHLSEPIF
jgi:hypothetical protein